MRAAVVVDPGNVAHVFDLVPGAVAFGAEFHSSPLESKNDTWAYPSRLYPNCTLVAGGLCGAGVRRRAVRTLEKVPRSDQVRIGRQRDYNIAHVQCKKCRRKLSELFLHLGAMGIGNRRRRLIRRGFVRSVSRTERRPFVRQNFVGRPRRTSTAVARRGSA